LQFLISADRNVLLFPALTPWSATKLAWLLGVGPQINWQNNLEKLQNGTNGTSSADIRDALRVDLLHMIMPGATIITSCHEKTGVGPSYGHRNHYACDLGRRAAIGMLEHLQGLGLADQSGRVRSPIGFIGIDYFRMPFAYGRQVQDKFFAMMAALTQLGLVDSNTRIILLNHFEAIENSKFDPSRFFDEVIPLRKEANPWYQCTTQYLIEMEKRGFDVSDLAMAKQMENGRLHAQFPFLQVRLNCRATQAVYKALGPEARERGDGRPTRHTKTTHQVNSADDDATVVSDISSSVRLQLWKHFARD